MPSKRTVPIRGFFEVACRKRVGRALSQKKDARIQLISVPKHRTKPKVNDKKVSAMCYVPPENSHVANYKMVLAKYPLVLNRDKWSREDKENLHKGIKRQFQEMLLDKSVDLLSGTDGSLEISNGLDSIIASVKDQSITPENIRLFLPKVNWERLSYMYAPSRSGAECEARWLNCEDPLINHQPWTNMEDKNLLHIVQQKGINNWIDTAVTLGTNRTPFQCLARYQRSLNASILKREWTEEDDNKLRAAVEAFGESNWQVVASTMEGRTGTQCSNRWIKSLHPARKRVGRWTQDEDKRLKVAVMLFGPKTWRKIAQYVCGRTHVQCRERWVNSLDPSLNMDEWTEEEDSRLKDAIATYGYCWSKVAACLTPRTDSQCRRRWKVLLPHEVPLLQAARKLQKAALISNFVDREAERPTLGPSDFVPLPAITVTCGSADGNLSGKRRRSRRKSGQIKSIVVSSCSEEVPALDYEVPASTCEVPGSAYEVPALTYEVPTLTYEVPALTYEVPASTNDNEIETGGENATIVKKKATKRCARKRKSSVLELSSTSEFICLHDTATLAGDNAIENRSVQEGDSELPLTCSIPGILESGNTMTLDICQGNRQKKSNGTPKKSLKMDRAMKIQASCSRQGPLDVRYKESARTDIVDGSRSIPSSKTCTISVCLDGNPSTSDIVMHSCRKRSRNSARNSFTQMPEGEVDDDMTLAHFCKSLKKRRREKPSENPSGG